MTRFYLFPLLAAMTGLSGDLPSIRAADEVAVPRILLLSQKPDGHPAGTHEYLQGQKLLGDLLQKEGVGTIIEAADEPWERGPELLDGHAGVVLFLSEGAKWLSAKQDRLAAFQEFARRKGGLVCLHWATGTKSAEPIENYANLFGACHGGPDRRYKDFTTEVHFATPEHPILRGIDPAPLKSVRDEFYFALKRPKDVERFTPLWQIEIDNERQTVAWAWERPDGGRSFGFTGLHYHKNWENPAYQQLVLRGTLWSINRLR